MKLRTLILLSATGVACSAAAVWATIEPRRPAIDVKSVAAADPAAADDDPPSTPETPALDASRFQAGKTLMMSGRLGHAVLPAGSSSETFLFVDVSADDAARARAAVPLNLSIVVDKSGSMKGKRLTNAMAAARTAIQRLRDGDVVSVVTYDTDADVVVQPTAIDAAARKRILAALDKPRAGGDTCISCGVDAGMRLLGERPGMVSRILLLSDGLATDGVRDLPGFRRIAEDCRRMGASITTIGVDLAYDERIMSALARDSNGGHFFVADAAGLPTIFDQEMETLTRTIANQAEVTIDLAPGVFAEEVFDRATAARGSQVVVPLGAFAAGEKKTVLVRLRVPSGQAGERPIAAVRLRYDDLVDSKAGECEGNLTARLSNNQAELTPLDGVVSSRVSGSETAAALTEANELVRNGRAREARKLLDDRKAKVATRRAEAARDCASNAAACPDEAAEAKFDKAEKALSGAGAGFADDSAEPTAAAPATQTRDNAKEAFDLSN